VVRTTVTLDDDLAEMLRRRAHEREVPFDQLLNEAIRIGLAGDAPRAKPYRMRPRSLGVRAGVDPKLASFDGDFHRFGGLDFEYLR
jgi:hypothetical protein